MIRRPCIIGLLLLILITGALTVPAFAQGAAKKPIDFTLKNTSGKKVKLSNFRGKVVLVDVWATWCGYCVQEIPGLIDLQQSTTDEKLPLQIIGISVDKNKDDAKQFAKKHKINYPILFAEDKAMKPFGQIYGLPTKFIINKDGVIVDKIIGAVEKDALKKRLDKYLN